MLQTTLVQIHKWKMTNQILNLNAEKYYRKKKKTPKCFCCSLWNTIKFILSKSDIRKPHTKNKVH